jgi:hypothetical protein
MSSWIVEDKSINFIVSCLRSASYSDEMFNSMINNILKENGFILNCEGDNTVFNLGYAMKNLNCKATGYRYKKNNNPILKAYKFEDVKTGFHNEDKKYIFQLLKSVQCFKYQCSEGNYIKTKLYKMFKDIEDVLKSQIIDQIPEYKKAVWE